MTPIPIKSVDKSEQEQAIAAIVLAFAADPFSRWIFPDPHHYLKYFPQVVRFLCGNAFEHGTGYCIEGFAGSALWLPPDVHPREEELGEVLMHGVHEQRHEEVFTMLERMASYHPTEPHWYLPMIGVQATHRGKGYGEALMEHALRPCDREQKLVYLESTNPKNISLYQRYGFEILDTIQIGSSPPVSPMLRRPQPRRLD